MMERIIKQDQGAENTWRMNHEKTTLETLRQSLLDFHKTQTSNRYKAVGVLSSAGLSTAPVPMGSLPPHHFRIGCFGAQGGKGTRPLLRVP